jgi:uncharacterized protein (DUF433 family)
MREGDAMSMTQVRIVDVGRGPQIEGQRVTVMDVFYYLHRCYDFDFIHQAMPSLTREQYEAVVEYCERHRQELVEREWRVDEFREHGLEPPHGRGIVAETDQDLSTQEHVSRLKEKMKLKLAERVRAIDHG